MSREPKAPKTAKTPKTPKPAKTPKAGKGRSGIAATGDGWVAPASAFDFLGDAYRLHTRRRLVLLVAIGLIAVTALGLAVRAVGVFGERNTAADAVAAAEATLASTRAGFADLTGPSGVPVETMLTQLAERREAAVGIAEAAPNIAGLLVTLDRIAVPGVTVTAVTVGSAAATNDTNTDGAATTATTGLTAVPVTLTGTVTDQRAIEAFVTAVEATGVIDNVDATFTAGTPGTITVTGTIGAAADRAAALDAELTPDGLPAPDEPATPQGGTR